MRRTATRSRGRNSTTSSPGWSGSTRHARRALQAPACRSCSPATTTSCRPTRTSIRPNPTTNDALLQPQSRARVPSACSTQGWIDAIRTLHPDAPMYTFWDYMRNRWPRDAGLRLDHLLLTPEAARAAGRCRRRPRRARRGRRERSCAGLDRAARRGNVARAGRHARKAESRASAAKAARQRPARRRSQRRARPLLVIDGDLFAHRSYHALPKTILRAGKRPGRRHPRLRQFPAAASITSEAAARRAGRRGTRSRRRPTGTRHSRPIRADASSTTRWSNSSTICRSSSRPAVSRMPRRRATKPTTSSPPPRPREERRGGTRAGRERRPRHVPARLRRTTILYPVRAGEMARIDAGRGARPATASTPRRCPTSSRCAAIPRTSSRARRHRPDGAADVLRQARHARGRARGRPLSTQAEGAAPLSLDRHDGPQGAAAAVARPDADMARGRGARPRVGPREAGGAAHRACR